jgi:hypothetical protein
MAKVLQELQSHGEGGGEEEEEYFPSCWFGLILV